MRVTAGDTGHAGPHEERGVSAKDLRPNLQVQLL